MKKILLFLFLLSLNNSFSQTTLDIIRASNYYSKAVSSYTKGSYNSALENLKNSEENLKGKTNKDLEYLKIMSNYKIKNYKVAFDLLVKYFDEDNKQNIVHYKNIEPYRKKYNVDYSEELTKIFVELENKYNIVKNDEEGDKVIQNIMSRIKSKFSAPYNSFEKLIYEKLAFQKTDDYYMEVGKHEYRTPEITISKKEYKKLYNDNYEVFYKISNVVGLGNWSDYRNSYYHLKLIFERKFSLSKYSYSFNFYESKRVVNFNNFPAYESESGLISRFKNLDLFKSENFGLKKSQEVRINFTSEETTVLEQNGILKKLRDRLKKEGML